MIVQYMGKRAYKIVTEAGDMVSGVTFYYAHPEKNVEGLMTDKVSVRDDMEIPDFQVGEKVDIRFTRYGKVEAIYKVTK